MADADSNRSRLLFAVQSAFGAPLATNPAMQALRFTADTFKANNSVVESNEIRSDRMRSAQLKTGQSINGGFALEFSDGTYDAFLEALLCSTFTANVLKNGVAAQKYFTIERGMMDITQFIKFSDCTPTSLALTIPSRGIVTGEFGFMGTVAAISATSVIGTGTLTDVTTSPIMASGPGINNIQINAAPIGVGVREIKLNISAALREREVVDSNASREFGRGAFAISGSLRMYFSTAALYNYFLANTSFALGFVVSDNATKKYTFLLPNCQPSDDNVVVSAIDTDIEETINFKAFADTGISAEISITKGTIV